MARKAPANAHRKGISLIELVRMFPDEEAARRWFVDKFASCHNIQELDTIEQMAIVTGGLMLPYRKLVSNNRLSVEVQA
ncbi:MAG: hypothetical protein F4006_05340 [Candidatus Dadabacteria bacterium]|nr:hypothetical protein [Candidatus Dadabacteria bacterium]